MFVRIYANRKSNIQQLKGLNATAIAQNCYTRPLKPKKQNESQLH